MMELLYQNFLMMMIYWFCELLYLDVLDLMLYDHVPDAPFGSLDALDEIADVEGLDVDSQCQPL